MSLKNKFLAVIRSAEIKDNFLRFALSSKKKLFKAGASLKHFVISTLPKWFITRPKAFNQWRKNDRKKKKYRSFKLQKKLRPEPRYIPNSYKLFRSSISFMWIHKRIFFYILCIHAIIYVALIRSPVNASFDSIQSSITGVLGQDSQKTTQGVVATLGSVLSISATSQTKTGIVAASILLMSLVYIWAIRELHAKNKISARDAYYKSMSPLISTSLVLMVMSLQLIPFGIAAFIYTTARTGGIFANGFEDLSFFIAAVLVAVLSLYWVTSTIIALYVVTLSGMYPMKALRVAKKLVQFQRFTVFKRIISVPVLFGLVYLLILTVAIRFLPNQVFLIVEFLQLLFLPLIHIYLYKLYRSLI